VGTGLIVAFVVTVWAAYFVPLALRRYDEAHAQSALELLSPMSRVIRRSKREEDLAVEEVDEFDEVEPEPVANARPPRPGKPGLTRASARIAARRRRRVLLTVLALNAIVGPLAGFAIIPLWTIAIPATLLVAWLVACRVQVRSQYGYAPAQPLRLPKIPSVAKRPAKAKEAKPSRDAKKEPKRARKASAAESEDTVQVAFDVDDVEPERRHIMEDVPLEADALDEQLVIAVPSAGSHGEMVWDPLPVTLPTYVTKPRAGRTVRTIDFDAPGAWTSGHVEGEEVDLPAQESAETDEARRAAGE
jgi:hypothetical protein